MGKNRVLVVERDEQLRRVMGRRIEKEGFGAILTGTTDEALQLFEKHHVVLLAASVGTRLWGSLTSVELVRKMRELDPAIPLIAFSATNLRDELVEAGCNHKLDNKLQLTVKLKEIAGVHS